MNVRSNSSRTSSETFASTGSAAVRAGPPARSSSQFADQETFMSFPLISDLGLATGLSRWGGAVIRFS